LPEKSPALKPRTCLRNPPVFDPSGYPATSVVAGIISEVISGETADLPFISMAWPRVPRSHRARVREFAAKHRVADDTPRRRRPLGIGDVETEAEIGAENRCAKSDDRTKETPARTTPV